LHTDKKAKGKGGCGVCSKKERGGGVDPELHRAGVEEEQED
jgi:hypothetical protein